MCVLVMLFWRLIRFWVFVISLEHDNFMLLIKDVVVLLLEGLCMISLGQIINFGCVKIGYSASIFDYFGNIKDVHAMLQEPCSSTSITGVPNKTFRVQISPLMKLTC